MSLPLQPLNPPVMTTVHSLIRPPRYRVEPRQTRRRARARFARLAERAPDRPVRLILRLGWEEAKTLGAHPAGPDVVTRRLRDSLDRYTQQRHRPEIISPARYAAIMTVRMDRSTHQRLLALSVACDAHLQDTINAILRVRGYQRRDFTKSLE